MSQSLHLTLAQLNPIVGDLIYNREKVLKSWQAVDRLTDLIIFPEMIICGYPPEDLILKPAFMDMIRCEIEYICEHTKTFKSAAIIPAPWVIEDKRYNCALLIENGEIKATIAKHHLPNYGVFDERRLFTSAPLPEPVDFHELKLGIMVCEDMWLPDVAVHLKKQGAEILIVPNGSPFHDEKSELRFKHAQARVKDTNLPLVYVNQVGGQDELVFDGGSFIMNDSGLLIHEAPMFEEDLYEILLEKNETNQWIAGTQDIAGTPPHLETIYLALVTGLSDYIIKNGFPGVLIGLSGGIDSALTAIIAVDALGADMVHCVMMPSEFTSQDSLDDAENLAKALGVGLDTISIEDPIQTLNNTLIPHFTNDTPDITFENMQSRMRGLILMALSNANGHMVLSTGNKSEMAVGYATLYGDMNGGFNALKDVYKTQVYALSKWRNENKPKSLKGPSGKIMPERIITKAPTAELKADQTDQDSLPEYEILDDILRSLIEEELDLASIVKCGHDKDTILRVWNMLDRAEYKRRQAPPGVKITSRAFGRDRRYPMTNHFVNLVEKSSQ